MVDEDRGEKIILLIVVGWPGALPKNVLESCDKEMLLILESMK